VNARSQRSGLPVYQARGGADEGLHRRRLVEGVSGVVVHVLDDADPGQVRSGGSGSSCGPGRLIGHRRSPGLRERGSVLGADNHGAGESLPWGCWRLRPGSSGRRRRPTGCRCWMSRWQLIFVGKHVGRDLEGHLWPHLTAGPPAVGDGSIADDRRARRWWRASPQVGSGCRGLPERDWSAVEEARDAGPDWKRQRWKEGRPAGPASASLPRGAGTIRRGGEGVRRRRDSCGKGGKPPFELLANTGSRTPAGSGRLCCAGNGADGRGGGA